MAKKICIPALDSEGSSDHQMLNSSKFFDKLNILFPNKIQFTIKEVATILNLSYDFVREKISGGSITAVKFGDRYMISVFELERILAQGVK
ncbi:MAG: helix-turn-helix domain-containing protein [Ignavibacteriales bacterium]|nr:helix-turn-helix domain-containing protein [Ignavibacteriales bacterium]